MNRLVMIGHDHVTEESFFFCLVNGLLTVLTLYEIIPNGASSQRPWKRFNKCKRRIFCSCLCLRYFRRVDQKSEGS